MEIHRRELGWFKQYTGTVTLFSICVQYTQRERRVSSMEILSACVSVTVGVFVSG